MYRVKSHSDKTVVIFCHFGVSMIFLSHLLNLPAEALLHGSFCRPRPSPSSLPRSAWGTRRTSAPNASAIPAICSSAANPSPNRATLRLSFKRFEYGLKSTCGAPAPRGLSALSYYEELYPPRDLEKGAKSPALPLRPRASSISAICLSPSLTSALPIRAAAFCIFASRTPTRSAASRAPWRR